MPIKNISGLKFGRLLVLSRCEDESCMGKGSYWLCKCDCGNEKIIRGASITYGMTKSCGCLRNERVSETMSLPYGVGSLNSLYGKYKKAAKNRNLEFLLSLDQFKILTSSLCFYCGMPPCRSFNNGGGKSNGSYIYNGIDRVDNSKGYFLENCVPCCKDCNIAKGIKTLDEFKIWVSKVYNKFGV
jgi:hypothetical protein